MNIKLRNILTLSLALLSTVSFAQSWDLESRTRANMHGDNGMMTVDERATLGFTVGGDNWGVHLSSDVDYSHHGNNDGSDVGATLYEAYASTDLFGFANLTVGRQAWDFGSGSIIGSNQWGDKFTRDGMLLGINNDVVDVSLGYSTLNSGGGEDDWTYSLLNASKSMGDFSANLLVIGQTDGTTDFGLSGLDVGYSAMGGKLDLTLSANAMTDGDNEADFTSIGATYNVSDNLSINASQTTYGDGLDFVLAGSDANGNLTSTTGSNWGHNRSEGENGELLYTGGSWLSHGNLGYLRADDVNLSVGVDYSTGDFDISYSMHTITNNSDSDYEKAASELSVGYSLNDNASLSLKWATDDRFSEDGDDYMWLTMTVRP
jgi:hypothetical protein